MGRAEENVMLIPPTSGQERSTRWVGIGEEATETRTHIETQRMTSETCESC